MGLTSALDDVLLGRVWRKKIDLPGGSDDFFLSSPRITARAAIEHSAWSTTQSNMVIDKENIAPEPMVCGLVRLIGSRCSHRHE